MITIPQLDTIQNISPTDMIMITHQDGTSEKISGENFMKAMAVDVIAENNMNSVTSNAVYNAIKKEGYKTVIKAFWQDPEHNNPLTYIENLVLPANSKVNFRIGNEHTYGSPYGDDADTDFYYEASINDNKWIRIIAYDIRSNRQFTIAKINNVWGLWSSHIVIENIGNYINNFQGNTGAVRNGNICQIMISGSQGTSGLTPNVATVIAKVTPGPRMLSEIKVKFDMATGYERGWITTDGKVWVYADIPVGYNGNLFIGGMYITD